MPRRRQTTVTKALTLLAMVVLAMFVLVTAASSGSVQVWVNPSPDGPAEVDRSVLTDSSVQPLETPKQVSEVVGAGLFLNVAIGAVVAMLLIGTLVSALEDLRPGLSPRMLLRRRKRIPEIDDEPPDPRHRLTINVEAARTALSAGSPSNAIVGCWMQLEIDAAKAGFERGAAETTSEYVRRVVTSSSVDPAPIAELAALFQEARFSRHELTEDHLDSASVALSGVVSALREFQALSA